MFCSDFLYLVKKTTRAHNLKLTLKNLLLSEKTSVRTNFSDKMSVVTFCPKFYPYGRFVRKYVRTDKISDGHFTILAVFGRNLSGIRPLSPKNGRNMSRSVSEIPGISELTRIPGISGDFL